MPHKVLAKAGPTPARPAPSPAAGILQRSCDCGAHAGTRCGCHSKHDAPADSLKEQPPPVAEFRPLVGQPLDAPTRAYMEPRFRFDFSRVRVHSSPQARDSVRAAGANAYTVGNHVFLGSAYSSSSQHGRRLLAHELAHVVQQHGGSRGAGLTSRRADAESDAHRAASRIGDGATANVSTHTPIGMAFDGGPPSTQSAVIVISLGSNEIEFRAPGGSYRYDLVQHGLQPGSYSATVSVAQNRVNLTLSSDTPASGTWTWRIRAGQPNPSTVLQGVTQAQIQIVSDPLPPIQTPAPDTQPPQPAPTGPDVVTLTPEEAQARCEAGSLPVVTFPVRFTRYNASYLVATREGSQIRVSMPMASYVNGRELPGMHHMPPLDVVTGILLEPNQIVRIRIYTPGLNPFADDQITEVCRTGEQMLAVSEAGDRAIMVNIALTALDALPFTPAGAAIGEGIGAGARYVGGRMVAPVLAASMEATEPIFGGVVTRATITAVEQRGGSAAVESMAARATSQAVAEGGADLATSRTVGAAATAGVSTGLGASAARVTGGLATSVFGRALENSLSDRGMRMLRSGGGGDPTPGTPGLQSDIAHVQQTTSTSCGPACGEMASSHHAATTPGSTATTQANLMAQAEFKPADGMNAMELQAALARESPVAGRVWDWQDFLPRGETTPETVAHSLEEALRQGNGVAILNTIADRGSPGEYMHWVIVRSVQGGQVLIHNPEAAGATLETITEEGFGRFYWTGDTIVAVPAP